MHNKAGQNRAASCAGLATLSSARLCRRRYVSLVVSFAVLPAFASETAPSCEPIPELLSMPTFEWPMPTGTTADIHSCNTGFVVVEFDILTNGSVADPRIIDSKFIPGCRVGAAKDDFFHTASIDQVSQFQFQPVEAQCSYRHRLSFEKPETTFGDADT